MLDPQIELRPPICVLTITWCYLAAILLKIFALHELIECGDIEVGPIDYIGIVDRWYIKQLTPIAEEAGITECRVGAAKSIVIG